MKKEILYSIIISLLFFTQARGVFLLIMPIVPLMINFILPLKINKRILCWSLFLVFTSALCGFFAGNVDWINILFSFYLFIPILILFYAKPDIYYRKINTIKVIKYTSYGLLFVDILGLISLILGNNFAFFYGTHFEFHHGLAVINILYGMYYFSLLRTNGKVIKKNLFLTISFVISFIVCDFGLGWIVLAIMGFIILFLEKKIKHVFLLVSLSFWAYIVFESDNEYWNYNRNNVKYALSNQENARKVLMFSNFIKLEKENFIIPMLGVGPGGFNSRTASLMSGFSDNLFTDMFGASEPLYYKKYIYPLWNNKFVSFENYTDGTRNKPWSSFVAICAEYGLILGLIFWGFFFLKIKTVYKMRNKSPIYRCMYYIDVYILISCILHGWVVSSEFILYILLRLLLEKSLIKTYINDTQDNTLLLDRS